MRTQLGLRAFVATAIVTIASVTPLAAEDKAARNETKIEHRSATSCVGLDIHTCQTKGECLWRKQRATRFGDVRQPHCRVRPYEQVAKKTA
ncbi:hypothetical protein [Hyphomicrobium sp. D-2]|uniref:hypothetical protein n=1 Tax=Hyphomicrobium sp. D-2 TaxID=3041621 RepID=UPI00245395FE|nr:hypothetical protein [Hyphomicrobium sp. D-2]MDH4983489.1 hypothetical protein [Hyphomicrobium sp. D-2]